MRQKIKKIVKFLINLWRLTMKTDAPTTEEPVDEDQLFTEEQMSQMDEMEESITDDALTHEEEPKTDAPTTKEPVEKDEHKTDAPKTEPPATEEPVDELADIKAEMAELKKEIAEGKEHKTEAPTTDEPIEEEDFLGEDVDMDELTRDPAAFNKLLNKVYSKGVETGVGRTKLDQSVVDSIPRIINENILEVASLEKVSRKFYEDNEDLIEHAKDVSEIFKELASKNPKADFVSVLKDVEPEIRKRLDIKKPLKVVKDVKDDDPPPRLPRKKSQPRQSPKPKTESDSMLTEMDEMDKSLGL